MQNPEHTLAVVREWLAKAENDLLTASKRPNTSFGMWADRVHIDPAAYVHAIRRPRHAR